MGKSYKKFPFCKCEDSCKWGKKQANRRVRRYKGELGNGREYKKLYNSWDICDYYFSETWKEYQHYCEQPRWWRDYEEPNYYEWYRTYKGK